MLPFLKAQRKDGGIATVYRKSDEKPEPSEMTDDSGLEAVAEDLLRGVHSHDKKLIVASLKAMFEIMESEPHHEGPHEE